jgi:lipopolysaccharide export system protein LptA
MKNSFLPALVLIVLFGLARPVWAEIADRGKPMNIEADALRYDDLKQVSVFTGNVILSKGTILIRGARLEVRQDPDGYQFGLVTGSPGQPAFFKQKREAVDEYIEGQGETIEYDGRADTVKFIQRAQLRRLRGSTVADEITGGLIVYENLTDKFSVDGNAGKTAGTPDAPRGRVRAMLMPKPESASGVAPSQPAPAVLKVSPTLGSSAP